MIIYRFRTLYCARFPIFNFRTKLRRMSHTCITQLTSGLIVAWILLPVVTGFSQSLDGRKFAAVIQTLANDGLGVDEYQVRWA